MPELILEIGGRVFEVACEPGQEPSLERAGALLDAEAARIGEAGRATEKRMLLLAGLMLADAMTGLQDQLRLTEERLRQADERIRTFQRDAAGRVTGVRVRSGGGFDHPVAPRISDRPIIARFVAMTRTDTMIPMRDGAKLYTVMIIPKGAGTFPIMLDRTP